MIFQKCFQFCKVLPLSDIIRYSILLKSKFDANFVSSFPTINSKILKHETSSLRVQSFKMIDLKFRTLFMHFLASSVLTAPQVYYEAWNVYPENVAFTNSVMLPIRSAYAS